MGENPPRPADTQQHEEARIKGPKGRAKRETSVWNFKDIRKAKSSIYRGHEGLAWAIVDLARKTNSAIDGGQIPGRRIDVGDIVQACVVSYFDGRLHSPETVGDSPKYATLPYEVALAGEGYLTAQPAVPQEALIHFTIPQTVGELVPSLPEEARASVLVSLQMKEALHKPSKEDVLREAMAAATSASSVEYAMSDKGDAEAAGFLAYLDAEGERGTPVMPARRAAGEGAEDEGAPLSGPEKETPTTREHISQRLQKLDLKDFGFGPPPGASPPPG